MRPILLLFLLSLISADLVHAAGWDESIKRVQQEKERMASLANKKGYPLALGSAMNEYMAQEHSCAILGRMLGNTEIIKHLEEELPKNSKDGYEYRLAELSLSNWIHNAKRLLTLDQSRKVAEWNLDCVGKHGIPASAYIQGDAISNTFFDIQQDGEVLRVLGGVTPGFASKLKAALDANPQIKVVALGSQGGSVMEALEAGMEIRKRGLETTLWNACYSACPLVFASGVSRTIWSPYPELGFHQISIEGKAVPANHPIYGLVRRYLDQMGVSGFAVHQMMVAAEPSSINIPGPEELCRAKVATWIQRSPFC